MNQHMRHSTLVIKLATSAIVAVLIAIPTEGGIIIGGDVAPDVSAKGDKAIAGDLTVGKTADGTVDVTKGSKLTVGGEAILGVGAGKTGSMTVQGKGATLDVAKTLSRSAELF